MEGEGREGNARTPQTNTRPNDGNRASPSHTRTAQKKNQVLPLTMTDVQLIIGPPRGAPMPAGATMCVANGMACEACRYDTRRAPPSLSLTARPAPTPDDNSHKRLGVTTVMAANAAAADSEEMGGWGQSFLSHIRPGRVAPNYHYLFQVRFVDQVVVLVPAAHARTSRTHRKRNRNTATNAAAAVGLSCRW